MINKVLFTKGLLTVLLFALLTLIQPHLALAYDRGHNWKQNHRGESRRNKNVHVNRTVYKPYHRHTPYWVRTHYPRQGRIEVWLPNTSIKVTIGGRRYHYYDGVYYQQSHTHYVVVPPPVIYEKQVLISPTPVESPSLSVSDQVKVSETKSTQSAIGDTFTINIPNEHIGGFTPVTLKKVEDGYLGPQGELYYEFPKVEELVAIYAE